ncbi:hypothetical protein PR202_ga05580 [Eleusine coracana subsp. coracana]|uniref:non-specific serine/threonine protein kinase n=1 Tax=Eleusine coracana subsp. coracana TaxID=191504 RepID=A0AAV5BTR5_ELECO|nr:hypothetical protein PR202_ga05126 [Eleusine coracana subsp. coracana]GJM89389.1 hypothetical protein PR202_ga05580 [Eleusine coracana subsp. coracana]
MLSSGREPAPLAAMTASCHLALVLLLLFPASSRARDTISPGQPLRGKDTLVSSGAGVFALGFFTPPGSNGTYLGVWYAKVLPRTVVWVANRAAPVPGAHNPGATFSVSRACALAVADPNSTVVWSASSPRSTGVDSCTAARIQDDGNLVVTDARGTVAWQGFDHPTDTMLPGMRVGVDRAAGKNLTLTAWASPSDPSPSAVTAGMETRGDPEVFIWNGPARVWRSGPWDGLQFTGVPDTVTYKGFTFRFVNTPREVTYSFQVPNTSILTRLTLNGTAVSGGLLQRWTWSAATTSWTLYWYAPRDQCDAVSACGPNGVCDTGTFPVCSCLRGFTPKSPAAWALRDGRDGCVRSTPLDCANGTDGFVVLPHAKVPDATAAVVDYDATLEQCKRRCLSNCSCTAYARANVTGDAGHRGCVIWTGGLDDIRVFPGFGQDLYVRLAAKDLAGRALVKEMIMGMNWSFHYMITRQLQQPQRVSQPATSLVKVALGPYISGYMAPEYAMDGVFSVKSDVFSFGVIVLEIITGIRNRGVYSYSGHLNLLAHAWSLLVEGKSLDLVDETLKGSFDSDEVLKCLKVGLLCVQENPDDRPLMSQVLLMLASTDIASLPTPKQLGFAARSVATEDSTLSKPDSGIVNSMTITLVEGR